MINFILFFAFSIFFYILHQKYIRRNFPPGPIPWPLIGSLVEVAKVGGIPPIALFKLSKKYGNLFSLRVGVVETVVVNGYETIRDLLKTEDYDNRIDDDWVLDRSYGKKQGILFSEGLFWRDTRRIMFRILRDFGFGNKTTMEGLIQEEFEEFSKILKKKVGQNERVTVDCMFNAPMANIVWSSVTGSRFSLEDPELKVLVSGIDDFMRAGQVGGTSLLGAFPFLSTYLPGLTGFNDLHEVAVRVRTIFERQVEDIRAQGTYKTSPSNFVEEFLHLVDANKDKDESGIYTDENIVCCMNDLFLAGSETSANTTALAIRLFVQHPHIQAKVRTEIDKVIGNRVISIADKPQLKYLEATILELLRYTAVAPIGPRRAASTYKYGDYTIVKGTSVIVNYYSALFDESVWGDPENFRPERFISPSTGEIINSDKLTAFGLGRRNCIGEVTARTSLFIGIGTLLQHFVFEIDPKSGDPGSELLPGLTTAPKPYTILIKNR